MARRQVKVPDIGDFSDVPVIEILVSEGDRVKADDPLITLESDKATMEVPSPEGGRVARLQVKVGDTVSEGTVIADLENGSESESLPAGEAGKPSPPEVQTMADAGASPPAQPRGTLTVVVPDIGDFSDVPVIEILVAPGDEVSIDDPLITLESDKATMEVPAPAAGTVSKVLVAMGKEVSRGTPVLELLASGAGADPTPPAPVHAPAHAPQEEHPDHPPSPAPQEEHSGHPPSPARAPDGTMRVADRIIPVAGFADSRMSDAVSVMAGPATRRLARELGVDLSAVTPTGARGRVSREDVKTHYIRQKAPSAGAGAGGIPSVPVVDFAQFGPVERVDLPRIRRISGPALQRSWLNLPHVTCHEEADITELDAYRRGLDSEAKPEGYRVTLLSFLIKCAVGALERHWEVNASLSPDGAALIRKRYYHIGVAVDTPGGLVVPVVRDADRKGITEISMELATISAKAREGKLSPQEMSGASFTISSLGGIGGTGFTPIVNAPEVAILGVSRAKLTPHWNGSAFVPRLVLPLSLSFDHRAVDGALATRFNARLRFYLEDVRRLLS